VGDRPGSFVAIAWLNVPFPLVVLGRRGVGGGWAAASRRRSSPVAAAMAPVKQAWGRR
jgi:hypothetical protein